MFGKGTVRREREREREKYSDEKLHVGCRLVVHLDVVPGELIWEGRASFSIQCLGKVDRETDGTNRGRTDRQR